MMHGPIHIINAINITLICDKSVTQLKIWHFLSYQYKKMFAAALLTGIVS